MTEVTTRKIVAFFFANENYVHDCDEGAMWDDFFKHIFGEKPCDPISSKVDHRSRPGSTDPNWDKLLHQTTTKNQVDKVRSFLRRHQWCLCAKKEAV